MRVANTAYYSRADPLGADGDFITAPEISQMFGEMVGIWLSDIWLRRGRPSPCYYVELGPGRGTLAADALRTMKRFGFEPEITTKIARIKNIRIYEVGISYYGRTYAEGKKINWKDGFRAIYCIIRYNLFA